MQDIWTKPNIKWQRIYYLPVVVLLSWCWHYRSFCRLWYYCHKARSASHTHCEGCSSHRIWLMRKERNWFKTRLPKCSSEQAFKGTSYINLKVKLPNFSWGTRPGLSVPLLKLRIHQNTSAQDFNFKYSSHWVKIFQIIKKNYFKKIILV